MLSNFLVINDEPISLEQALNYLQNDNSLQYFLSAILRQHVIAQKLKLEPDLQPTTKEMKDGFEQFQQKNQISEIEQLQEYLENKNLSCEQLLEQVNRELWIENLINHISQPRLHEYFIKHKQRLDQVTLSHIVVNQETLAEELHDQLQAGASFAQLARDYSIAENQNTGGKMQPMSLSDLPDELRIPIAQNSQLGSLIGPIKLQSYWHLFRLEEMFPAALEGKVEKQLKTEIFQEWLNQEIAATTVKTQVTQWLFLKTSTL
jgi:PPIC-type PPIASE domain